MDAMVLPDSKRQNGSKFQSSATQDTRSFSTMIVSSGKISSLCVPSISLLLVPYVSKLLLSEFDPLPILESMWTLDWVWWLKYCPRLWPKFGWLLEKLNVLYLLDFNFFYDRHIDSIRLVKFFESLLLLSYAIEQLKLSFTKNQWTIFSWLKFDHHSIQIK